MISNRRSKLRIYDMRPDERMLSRRLKKDGVTGVLESIVITRDHVSLHGNYEVICTGVFSGSHLLTFYEVNKAGSIRRTKRRRGKFERSYRYAKPYRIAGPEDFERLNVNPKASQIAELESYG